MNKESQANLGREADARYARWAYERVLLQQPQIPVTGLWASDNWFYIICTDLQPDTRALDGKPLKEWFQNEGKATGSPVMLAAVAPDGAQLVPERTTAERINMVGVPHTVRELFSILSLSVPNDFPSFDFHTKPPVATFYVSRVLMTYEETMVRNAIAPYLGLMRLEVVVDEARFERPLGFRHPVSLPGDIELVPARRLPKGFSQRVKALVEADEDHWVINRNRLLGAQAQQVDAPKPFDADTSKCLIDASAFPPRNLRTALTLYGQVQIAMPLAGAYDAALKGFQVTEAELVSLVDRGRVTFLLPQSIDRYPPSLVEKVAELNGDTMLMSRSLAALTVQDRARRMPFLYTPLSFRERHELLSALVKVEDPRYRTLPHALASELGRIWASSEDSLNFRGAMGLFANGVGQIVATMVESLTGRELRLEMWTAGSGVEWAAALDSTLIPFDSETYSEQRFAEILAGAYSGIENRPVPTKFGEVEVAVGGLLSLDNDAPILDIAEVFNGSDVERMRKLAFRVADPKAECIAETIETFNQKVARYERNSQRLERVDLLALAAGIAAASPIRAEFPVASYVPLGVWIMRYLLQKANVTRDFGGLLAERLRAINALTSRDVVMVSRLRRAIAGR